MNLRRAASIAACILAVTAGPAAAQAPWPAQQQPANSAWPSQPQQQQPAAAPWPAQPAQQQQPAASPWTAQPQQEPPCIKEFTKLRDDAQKRANAIQQASQRKATPKEACALFNAFSAAEVKMIKFATDNFAKCGIPSEVAVNLKKGHAKTSEIRTKICEAAVRPAQPAGPSLSDALNAPVADSKNIRSGGGTFDTLSGTPLGPR
ncbi:MAG: hypothetical protein HY244_04345 [Rhizobiales bacterium]|nr:hypothetical protein [Hyphomicrobiales bacterium]